MRARFVSVRRILPMLAAVAMLGISSMASPVANAAATCVYNVQVFAFVRENPSHNSSILKSKGAFERVTGPCRADNGFIAVYTSAASDGIGWIDRSKLF
jgi:hypothetical protein